MPAPARPARPAGPPVTIVPRHHALVRLAHWLHLPLLLGLAVSGLAIHWAAPVFTHAPDPVTGSRDLVGDLGVALARVFGPGRGAPREWIYEHFSLGRALLANALRMHWAFAYPYMLAGLLWGIGLLAGGGWRALAPRRTDPAEAVAMLRFYLGAPFAALRRKPHPHPHVAGTYNALQRGGYLTMMLLGALVVLSGWAMHKPVQLGWLERLFGNYDGARVVHFLCLAGLTGFLVPHVVLVLLDGWDTLRAMLGGWSARPRPADAGRGMDVPAAWFAGRTRRAVLLHAAGAAVAVAGAWWLLPDRTKARLLPGGAHDRLDTLAARFGLTGARRERALDGALTFDDDVAEALYSPTRRVRTYSRAAARPLRNNYHGRTPGPEILQGWSLRLSGLAAGGMVQLPLAQLLVRFPAHEQVTRLVCVEGWSGVAWWGGLRFADLLAAFPPAPGARWAALRSDVSLDGAGRPEPYYVSIDLATARHPQALLATHHDGRPLTLAHGAPLRLVVPMKLGLKNIKAITSIEYVAAEPADYWNARGYSRYDGL